MIYGKLKDVVRAGIGHDDLNPDLLDYYLASGRRAIEKRGNFYWMENRVTFDLTADDQEYTLASPPISITGFKDVEFLGYRDPDDTQYTELPWISRDSIDRRFATDEAGPPQAYTVTASDTLFLTPIPDVAYEMVMIYYSWTSNPSSNLSEDELCARFPEALVTSAVAQGIDLLTHNQELVSPWGAKFERELQAVKRHDAYRRQMDQVVLFPARGPGLRRTGQWGW